MRAALALAMIAGCAHTPDLGLRMTPAAPPGATAETFIARDQTRLYALHWAPAKEPRGVVVIMHGLKDYSARYTTLAVRLMEAGFAVYAFDMRGHGQSAGPRVSPDRWLDYVDDLDRFLTEVEKREPNRKIYVFGHSMGGAISALTVIEHKPQVAGLILSAPAVAIDAPPLLVALVRMAGLLTSGARGTDLPNREFTSDSAAAKVMDEDPLISQTPGPVGTAAGLIDGMRLIFETVDRLTLPLLVMHGTRDSLTAPFGSRALVDAASSTDKTLKIYEGLYHDLLHEPRGKEVEDDIIGWLEARNGGEPQKPSKPFVGRLRGEPGGWTQSVELNAGLSEDKNFAGLVTSQLAVPRPFGWHSGLSAAWVGDYKSVALRPLGVAYRFWSGVVGVSAGGGLITGAHFALSFAGWLEVPLGPVHLGMFAERLRRITNTNMHGPLGSDQLWTNVSLRYGSDREYWPGLHAGVGPVVMGGCAWQSVDRECFVTLGVQLYGAD